MTTIETIAEKAGVSRGTVDRVLHNRGQVKPETAEKVRAVMEEMDFQPNALGRAFYLSRKKNKIGVLVSFREPDFQAQVMQGVSSGIAYAKQHGVETLTEFAPPRWTGCWTAACRDWLCAVSCQRKSMTACGSSRKNSFPSLHITRTSKATCGTALWVRIPIRAVPAPRY